MNYQTSPEVQESIENVFDDLRGMSKEEFRDELDFYLDGKDFDIHSTSFLRIT